MQDDEMADAVIKLHDIARMLEKKFGGRGLLSDDIRDCANRLHTLVRPVKPPKENLE